MPDFEPLRIISDLLSSGGAALVVAPERFAPSTIYDINYRVAVIACAFEAHAKRGVLNERRIQAARLKLYQFIAIRPWLVPVLHTWVSSDRDPQRLLPASQRLRRGFLGDYMHDHVVDFLIARSVLVHESKYIASGSNASWLTTVTAAVANAKLFTRERDALVRLKDIKITNNMLEGW